MGIKVVPSRRRQRFCVPCETVQKPTIVWPASSVATGPPQPCPLQLGATVPNGQMAMEELLLLRMREQHRTRARDAAAKAVLTSSQAAMYTKAKEELQSASSQDERMEKIVLLKEVEQKATNHMSLVEHMELIDWD